MSSTLAFDEDALTDGVMTRRIGAWLIDLCLVAVLASLLWTGCLLFGFLTFGLGFGLLALLPLVPAAYHVLFLASAGAATPGQRLMGLTVRREADLGPPGLLQAIVTTAGLMITLATGVVWLAVALFTPHHQTLHDMVAGVVVVNRRVLRAGGAWYAGA